MRPDQIADSHQSDRTRTHKFTGVSPTAGTPSGAAAADLLLAIEDARRLKPLRSRVWFVPS
jgi:hypothetical protein